MSDISSPSRRAGMWAHASNDIPRVVLVLTIVGVALGPLGLNEYWRFVASMMLIYTLVTLGFNILLGYLGRLAFANAAFFGVGAYAATIAMNGGLNFIPGILVGWIGGGIAGFLVGIPALRIRNYQLAIVTLATGELLRWLYIHGGSITQGSSGLEVPAMKLAGYQITTEIGKYWVFLVFTVLCLTVTRNLLRSSVGRAIVAVRESESVSLGLGMHAAGFRILAFVWSGALVGVAGGMYACLLGRITPESFGLTQLLVHFSMVMVGGLGSFVGSIFGALLLTAIPETLRNFPGLEEIVFSLLLIIVLRFVPEGIGGFLGGRISGLRDRFFGGKS